MSFFDKLFGYNVKKSSESLDSKLEVENEDVSFVKRFKSAGGCFFYCDTLNEAYENLVGIINGKQIEEMLCMDQDLIKILNALNLKSNNQTKANHQMAFIKCEYLVALDGSIMISSDQTFHINKSDLPNEIIVMASPNQIISSLSVGLTKIRQNKQNKIPSNITSLYGNQMQGFSDISTAKKLYLLLVEDFNLII